MKKYLFIIVLFSFSASASPLSRTADAYFEAKDYPQAAEAYQKLAQEPTLASWQRAALQYNQAVSELYANKPDEALRILQQIETSSPYILNHIKETLAIIQPKSSESSDPPETQIYMQTAVHWMNKNTREAVKDPFVTLKYAIEDQEYALSINRLYKKLENPSEEIGSLIKNAQTQTLKTADPFYAQVLEKEKQDYPRSCQCQPWDTVIPSFEEGYRRAKWEVAIIAVQEEILRYWKQSQENATKQKESSPQEPSKIQDVFREIEKMEEDDKQPKPAKPLSGKGIKPW